MSDIPYKTRQALERMAKRGPVKKRISDDAAVGQKNTLDAAAAQTRAALRAVDAAVVAYVTAEWKSLGGEDKRVDVRLDDDEHLDIAIAALQAEKETRERMSRG